MRKNQKIKYENLVNKKYNNKNKIKMQKNLDQYRIF